MAEWLNISGGNAAVPQQGPFWRTFLVKDSTVGDDVGDNVPSFGARVNQVSRIRRIVATLKRSISADLEVRFRVVYPSAPFEEHTIGTFTIPSSTAVQRRLVYQGDDIEWPTLPDCAILIPDILASDGSKNKNGIASFTIEWVGRGAGEPTAEGAGGAGSWYSGGTYAKGDIVEFNGSGYISLVNDNTNHIPSESPDYWAILVQQGEQGNTGNQGPATPHGFGATFVSSPTAGMTAYVTVPHGGTITAYDLVVRGGGTATVEIWKTARAAGVPTSGDSINTSGLSTGSTPVYSTDTSDFTSTTVADGDRVIVNLVSVVGTVDSVSLQVTFGTPSSTGTSTPPSGGDDTGAIQSMIDQTPDGGTLIIDGIQDISDTLSLNARNNLIIKAHPINGGGFRIQSGSMTGPFGAALYMRNCVGVMLFQLEIDGNSYGTRPMFIDGGRDNVIRECEIHDVATGATSAIGSRVGLNLKVQDCTIYTTGTDVRGVWLGAGNDYETQAEVSGCTIHDTGHTGIAIEGSGITITNNILHDGADGAGFKVIQRGTPRHIYCTGNSVTDWTGGASVEGTGVAALGVHITDNTFTRCLVIGYTFGSLYVAGNYTYNLDFSNNTIVDCGSVGALRNARNVTVSGNTVTGTAGNPHTLFLEHDDSGVTITTAGGLTVDSTGTSLSNIVVDGVTIIP